MSLLKRLFGGGSSEDKSKQSTAVEHAGFRIYPEPTKTSGGLRIGARIEKELGGETMVHQLIRADVISDPQEAETASVNKAKQIIDEQGDRLFD